MLDGTVPGFMLFEVLVAGHHFCRCCNVLVDNEPFIDYI